MNLNIKMQIAAALFLIGIYVFYFRRRKVHTKANQIFSEMLIVTAVNLVLDMLTVVELSYQNIFSRQVIDLSHKLFFISIDVMAYLIYRYLLTVIHNSRVLSVHRQVLSLVPLIVSVAITMLMPVYYEQSRGEFYSNGYGVLSVFISIGCYLLLSLYFNFRYWKTINPHKRSAILVAVFIMASCLVIQGTMPTFFVSGYGLVLLLWCMFLSLENPIEYMDQDTKAMNNHAFQVVMKEKFVSKIPFTTLTIVFDDWNLMNSNLGPKFGNELIMKTANYFREEFGFETYLPLTGCPTIICERMEAYSIAELVIGRLEAMGEVDGISVNLKWHIYLADYPNHGTDIMEVERNINFFATHPDTWENQLEEEEVEGNPLTDDERIIMYDLRWAELVKRESTIEQMLRDALINDGIEMNYQPIYSTDSKDFHSAEALVRLKDKETLGFVSPEEFITIAERKGLIIDLSMMILEKVCRFIKEGELKKLGLSYMEVNLSAVHCMDTRLVSQLTELMRRYDIAPEFLNLEITETTALNVTQSVLSNLETLINMGCGFSMDDYGTGYSNLIQIADLTFDIAKLDKSLVWGYFSDDNKKEKVILTSTVNMFKQLDMRLVAEGVETEEQSTTLQNMGVDYLQGYYYSRPIPENEFVRFLQQKNVSQA